MLQKKSTNAIEVNSLRKSYGKLEVLKGVSFKVKTGEILALLGPNGAGKTTTIRMLSTLLQPDSGTIRVAGFDPVKQGDKVRSSIGLTGQFAAVDEYLTGKENIEIIGKLYHMQADVIKARTAELLEKLDLVEAANRPAKTYSGGMKRRLDLAMSLVAAPPIIFLDEPTTGLDPRSRQDLWRMIKQLAKDGTTILLTTQYMEEAEYLADNVIVIDHGKVIAEGTVNELKSKVGAEQVEIVLKKASDAKKTMQLLGNKAKYVEDTLTVNLPADKGVATLRSTLEQLGTAKIDVDTASLRRPTLDDVFLALTGHDTTENEETKK
jgi:ABC-2 type transport system ATP-binding protein